MYKQHTVAVVVPAHNEQGFVGAVIDSMPGFVDRIYVIDDCSSDGTWPEIEAHAAKHNDAGQARTTTVSETVDGTVVSDGGGTTGGLVVPIRHETNRGVGGAIKTGYLRARADEIDVTAVMAGDGQMEPGYLPDLLDPIVEGKADYAKGNRLLHPTYREGMSNWRLFGNGVLSFLTKIASGYWKTADPQNGYTAISGRALEAVAIEEMYEYYGYCNDLLVKLNAEGLRVADVSIPAVYGEEESGINYPSYIRHVSGMLFTNFLWRLKRKYLLLDFHPLALFYLFGVIGSLIGLLGIAYTGIGAAFGTLSSSAFVNGVLSIIVFALGSLFVLFAIVFDMRNAESLEVLIDDR